MGVSLNSGSRSTGRGRFISGVIVGMLIAAAFVGGQAIASIPNSGTGVISGCRNLKTGALRVIDTQAHKKCVRGEASLSWNVRGQQGLQGVPGTPGAAGAPAVKYWARIAYDGTVQASSGGVTAAHGSTGIYSVTFPAGVDLSGCAYDASVFNTVDMIATPMTLMGNVIGVYVRSQEAYPYNGYYDANFSLAIMC